MEYQFNTVEEALEELRAGHLILTIDDPDRENEGDLICAAQFATTENVNFMATHAKVLICTPMSEQVALRLGLEQMVKVNTDNHHTAFTVSIDHVDTTTGISAGSTSAPVSAFVRAAPSGIQYASDIFQSSKSPWYSASSRPYSSSSGSSFSYTSRSFQSA